MEAITRLFNECLAEEIRFQLYRRGKTQQWLAERIWINRAVLSRKMHHRSPWSLVDLLNVAKAFGFGPASFVQLVEWRFDEILDTGSKSVVG